MRASSLAPFWVPLSHRSTTQPKKIHSPGLIAKWSCRRTGAHVPLGPGSETSKEGSGGSSALSGLAPDGHTSDMQQKKAGGLNNGTAREARSS
eukprot:scaffold3421_cov163-Pinguiococcus_pyrenoidosus.AAC.3